jgi:subtilisin family serine protease
VSLSGSSSYGPTDDFRIKPDITNKGINVLSTSNASATAYDTASGTSMAAPGVSGVLILLQEHYSNLNNNDFMLAATAKGLILHTADEAGPNDGPDHMFGWGLINARRAAEVLSGNAISSIVEERTLTNGQTYTRDVFSVGNQPLMVSISWTDRPGNINQGTIDLSNPVLVNDLDIRVTRNGQTVMPWALNKSFGNPAAQRMDNNVDPFEKSEILNHNKVFIQ